jgi:hypothetical protein
MSLSEKENVSSSSKSVPNSKKDSKASLYASLPVLGKDFEDHVHNRDFYESKIKISSDTTKAQTGIYTENGKQFIICPKSLFGEDSIIGAMIKECAVNTQTTIYLNSTVCTLKPDYDEKWLIGLWFGITASKLQKRRVDKKDSDLGMTCGHALNVLHYFADTPELGQTALARDNFFFGNNPTEKTSKNISVGFYTKIKFITQFTEAAEGQRLWSVINYFSKIIGLTYYDPEEINAVVEYHLRKFEDVCASFTHITYTSKKGKKVETGQKKANLPKKSPLLLNEESVIIDKLLSYKWESLANLAKDWIGFVMAEGFATIMEHLSQIYQSRWILLAKYAKMTTKRLQRIRELIPDKRTAKKAAITRDNVLVLLRDRQAPVDQFYREIVDIIPEKDLIRAASELKQGKAINNMNAEIQIKKEITAMYAALNFQSVRHLVETLVSVENRNMEELKQGLVIVYKAFNLVSKAKHNMTGTAHNYPLNKVVGKLTYLEKCYEAANKLNSEWNSLNNVSRADIAKIAEIPLGKMKDALKLSEEISKWVDQFVTKVMDRDDVSQDIDGVLYAHLQYFKNLFDDTE